jgi:hypothetical protein
MSITEIYESTMALSVYNCLSLSRQDLSRDAIEAFLRNAFDQNLPEDYVPRGVDYLVKENLADEQDGLVKIRRLPDLRGVPVVRVNDDRELARGAY